MTLKAKPDFKDYGIFCGDLKPQIGNLVKQHLPESCLYVADSNTLQAARHLLPATFPHFIFKHSPKATGENVALISEQAQKHAAIIAVGSGTINDLCKMATYQSNKPYAVIATAASMNGYVSANASINIDGFKSTLPAKPPVLTLLDDDLLSHAPMQLTRAGVGDALCRATIQADWLLSHLLFETDYNDAYFNWSAQAEDFIIQLLSNDVAQPKHYIAALSECLLASGLAMRDFGSSAPASQGEHLIAHMMEMLTSDRNQPYHGEAIAITTLTMATLQETFLNKKTVPRINDQQNFSLLPDHLQEKAKSYYYTKFPDSLMVNSANQQLQQQWDNIRINIKAKSISSETLKQVFDHAGCVTSPAQLGWDHSTYEQAIKLAPLTRDRFTFLDLI